MMIASLLPNAEIPQHLESSQVEELLEVQRNVLSAVALGTQHQETLELLCRSAEFLLPNSVASIMLFNEDRTALEVTAAPNIPSEAIAQLNGLIPSEFAGSCGTAVFKNKPQFVVNTKEDKRWDDFEQFVKKFSIGACWSMPIRDERDQSFGSFALSSFEVREPSEFHKHIIATAASLASIVIKRKQEQDLLEYAANHDTLTGLANRNLLNHHLEDSILKAKRDHSKVALLFMDLDNFKLINDTQGHDVGDEILQTISKRLKTISRKSDTLARLGGDEFILLIDHIDDAYDIQHIAEKILHTTQQPITIEGTEFSLSISIGISLYPNDGRDAKTLIKNADTAMYAAKDKGRNQVQFYREKLSILINERAALETELRHAIEHNEFIVYYQPIYSAKDEKVIGAEALVRWKHPTKGLVYPDDFISLSEELGLISDIGKFVTTEACRQCKKWWGSGIAPFTLSVNISAKQLKLGFADWLAELLEEVQFPIHLLELEVTETLIMQPTGVAINQLNQMQRHGINISLDDFGTGHSSLSKLKNLPITKLKIDQSFVKNITEGKNDRVIAKTIIAMGHSLELSVVAEGVETTQQKNILNEEGCDLLQGYLFSKAIDAASFEKLLETSV